MRVLFELFLPCNFLKIQNIAVNSFFSIVAINIEYLFPRHWQNGIGGLSWISINRILKNEENRKGLSVSYIFSY